MKRMKHPGLDAVIEVVQQQIPIYVQSGWVELTDEENAEMDTQDAAATTEADKSSGDSAAARPLPFPPADIHEGAASGAADSQVKEG